MRKFEISYSRTVNLGNYESARLELREEFDADNISRGDAYRIVKKFVEAKCNK